MEERIEIMQHNLKLIKEFLGQIQYMAIMYLLESKLKEGKLNNVQWRFLQDYLLSIKMIKKNTYEEEIL